MVNAERNEARAKRRFDRVKIGEHFRVGLFKGFSYRRGIAAHEEDLTRGRMLWGLRDPPLFPAV